ncbi:MAG: hypothetical protein EA398_11615 [Deltaproteobacteria bacterium]|nr:MAG: hypothetical protein EA398_11615 [Deltaproteobacteria bacterium]
MESARIRGAVFALVAAVAVVAWAGCGADGADAGVSCPDGWLDMGGECVEPGPGCEDGLDRNGDGHCDRERVDWSREARLPEGGDRRDIYGLGAELEGVVESGLAHVLVWPVDISGALLPWQPLQRMLDPDATERRVLDQQDLARRMLGFGTTEEMYDWVGLPRFDGSEEAMPGVRWPEGLDAGTPLGAGIIDTRWGEALTYSCATCHVADLFGRTVVGATNRRARANEYFHVARQFYPTLPGEVFQSLTDPTELELELFLQTQQSLLQVETREPLVRGLDTSLAQVGLSLSKRALDEWASVERARQRNPRENLLDHHAADSKPAVWWTLRYKTRWLSDGSIVSGNPIFTNFLWNEIGRGTDLEQLERWLRNNMHIVDELTVAAFATEAPRYEDFFGLDRVDLAAAQRGQAHFNAICSACHGTYTKGWELDDAAERTQVELLRNVHLDYPRETQVVDVGTSPQRAQGMAGFADRLNELAISQWMETVVEVQDGYVPPPLDGIWARYPYFHNASVPSLCEVIRPARFRTTEFWIGPDEDPDTDFDHDCVGLPVGDAVPAEWRDDPHNRHDTSVPGLSNQGHESFLLDADGNEILDAAARRDLVEFLKTL